MTLEELITSLQKKPYHTRVRILWGTIAVVALVLFTLWIISIKSSITGLDTQGLVKSVNTTAATQVSFASVERAEAGSSIKLYFNFDNPSDDILNIPILSNITLTVKGKSMNPTQITDRQGKPFVQKVLSHEQNFGILVFPTAGADSAELTFNQMFFERSPEQILSQKIELDLKKLQKTNNLRN